MSRPVKKKKKSKKKSKEGSPPKKKKKKINGHKRMAKNDQQTKIKDKS